RQLLRQLPLSLGEEVLHYPGTAARVPVPILIEALYERACKKRLELPGAQIARRIEARIHVHERVRGVVREQGGVRERGHVEVGERSPRHLARVELVLVDQLRRVAPEEVQLLEAHGAKKVREA